MDKEEFRTHKKGDNTDLYADMNDEIHEILNERILNDENSEIDYVDVTVVFTED